MTYLERLRYVRIIRLNVDPDIARRNADALWQARATLGDRHILVRPIDRPGDYWYGRNRTFWEDFDARR